MLLVLYIFPGVVGVADLSSVLTDWIYLGANTYVIVGLLSYSMAYSLKYN